MLNEQPLFVQPVVKPGLNKQPLFLQPCWTNSAVRSTLNEQPLFVQHGCEIGLYNRLDNWFDNQVYRVYKHSTGCQTGIV